jgi:hypothetical protein
LEAGIVRRLSLEVHALSVNAWFDITQFFTSASRAGFPDEVVYRAEYIRRCPRKAGSSIRRPHIGHTVAPLRLLSARRLPVRRSTGGRCAADRLPYALGHGPPLGIAILTLFCYDDHHGDMGHGASGLIVALVIYSGDFLARGRVLLENLLQKQEA